DPDLIATAAAQLAAAQRPVILAGGGAKWTGAALQALASRLDAPVVQTANARGVMFDHPLGVPASASLASVRALIEAADLVLAVGTELGPTDYDVYATGQSPRMARMIRIDICPAQLRRHPAELTIESTAEAAMDALLRSLPDTPPAAARGAERAAETRAAALDEIGPAYRDMVEILAALRQALPACLMVGDSTQAIYAGNLYYDHDRPGGWFNAATGYGALGYALPAAIGASLGAPGARVLCIAGDGGAQFTMPEIMAAVDARLPITFLIWNNHGYQEIASAMEEVGVTVLGCDPTPPDFAATAQSFSIPFTTCDMTPESAAQAVTRMAQIDGPSMIELRAPRFLQDPA
ncbi:MAG: thiamine pyrophosphate-dependent enzyme, partial [Pseudomonadota bacterium]